MTSEPELIARLADALGVEPGAITRTTTAKDLEAWDSMGTMNILLLLNDEFDIKLAPKETTRLQSVD
jgi:acyl carrier protein